MLHVVNAIGLETLQALVNLLGRGALCPAVNLGHQEHLVAVAVAQGFAHPEFAAGVVIVPAVGGLAFMALNASGFTASSSVFEIRI